MAICCSSVVLCGPGVIWMAPGSSGGGSSGSRFFWVVICGPRVVLDDS